MNIDRERTPMINSRCGVLAPAAGSENSSKMEELSGMRDQEICVELEAPSGPVLSFSHCLSSSALSVALLIMLESSNS